MRKIYTSHGNYSYGQLKSLTNEKAHETRRERSYIDWPKQYKEANLKDE